MEATDFITNSTIKGAAIKQVKLTSSYKMITLYFTKLFKNTKYYFVCITEPSCLRYLSVDSETMS